jgi:hypothetical protein
MTLQELLDWQAADKNDRHVKIDIKADGAEVWVYSHRLREGSHLTSNHFITAIDLEGQAALKEKAQFEELKKKFGG